MISLIAAMSKNRVIGKNGKIPWHLPADLKRFKGLTMGHPVIMGRKTYESIGHALPGRTNIILSRTPGFNQPDAVTVPSLKEALDLTRGAGEVFIIGGESVYRQALPLANKIYLTVIGIEIEINPPFPSYSLSEGRRSTAPAEVEGQTGQVALFPEFNESEWEIVSREEHEKDEKNPYDYTYAIYERRKR